MSSSSLRTLNIDSYYSYDGGELGLLGLSFPQLRNLCVAGARMSSQDLESLLSCCAGLQTFIYDATSNFDLKWSLLYVKPSDIIKYLSRHRETLTTLRLDLQDAQPVGGKFMSEPMPNLQIFSALRDLSLDSIFIYNDMNEQPEDDDVICRILPPTLVLLSVHDYRGKLMLARLARGLLHLAEATSQGQFVHLNRVRCYTREPFDGYGLDEKFASTGNVTRAEDALNHPTLGGKV
ncbi:hypothetical protein F4778DRAFT_777433 [Xylariomycetidae sp. FL2044]|nr:hypothetical protein F4778DRAFT_777433 [Xylariomycetidae sp. FL2044]